MFCVHCGKPSETEACAECAAKLQATPAPSTAVPANGLAAIAQAFLPFIAAGMALLALIWGILNLFSVFHVLGVASYNGESEVEYITVSDMADTLESMDKSFATGYIGNIAFGLACLGVAAIGILFLLKVFMGMPYYDQFIAANFPFGPLLLMGILGAAGCMFQVLMYLFCGGKYSVFFATLRVSCGVNWTTWMMLVLFVGLIVVDRLVLNKKPQA